jgi:hypothetical protein
MKELLKTRRESVLCIKGSHQRKVEEIQMYSADLFIFTRLCFQRDLHESVYEEEEKIIFEDDQNYRQWRRAASIQTLYGYRDDDFTKSPFIRPKRKAIEVGSDQKKRRIEENDVEKSSDDDEFFDAELDTTIDGAMRVKRIEESDVEKSSSSDNDEFFDAELDTTIDGAMRVKRIEESDVEKSSSSDNDDFFDAELDTTIDGAMRVTIPPGPSTQESSRPQSPHSVEYHEAIDVPPQSPQSPAYRSLPMSFQETIDPVPQTTGAATKPCILAEFLEAIDSPPSSMDNDRREDSGLGEDRNYHFVPPLADDLDEDLNMDYANVSSPLRQRIPTGASQTTAMLFTHVASIDPSAGSYERWLASQTTPCGPGSISSPTKIPIDANEQQVQVDSSPNTSRLEIDLAEEIVADLVVDRPHEEETEVLPLSDLPSSLFAFSEVAPGTISSPIFSPTHAPSPLLGSNDVPLQESLGFTAPAGSLECSVAESVASSEDSYEQWLASQNNGDADESVDPNVSPAFEVTEPEFYKPGPSQIDDGIQSVDSMSEDVSFGQSGRFDSAHHAPVRTRKKISDGYEIPPTSRSLEDTPAEIAIYPADEEGILSANVSAPGPDSYEAWLASQNPTPEQHTLVDHSSGERQPSSPRQALFGRLTDKESPEPAFDDGDDAPDANTPALPFVSDDSQGSEPLCQNDLVTNGEANPEGKSVKGEDPLISAYEALAETKGGIKDQTIPYTPINQVSAEQPFLSAEEALLEPQVDSTVTSEESEDLRSKQSPDSLEAQGNADAATTQLHSPFLSAEETPLEPQVDSTVSSEESEDLRSEQLPDSEEAQGSADVATTQLHSPFLSTEEAPLEPQVDSTVSSEESEDLRSEQLPYSEEAQGSADAATATTQLHSPFLSAEETPLEPQVDSTVSSEESETLRSEQLPYSEEAQGSADADAATIQLHSPFLSAEEALLEPHVDSTVSLEESETLRSEQLSDSVETRGDADAATTQLHSPTLIDHRSAERKPSSPRQVLFGRLTDKESTEPTFSGGRDAPDVNVSALQLVSEENKGFEPPRQTGLSTPSDANPEDNSIKIEDPALLTKNSDDLTSKLKDCVQLWGAISPLCKAISVDEEENYSGSEKENGASRNGCDSPVGPDSTVSSLSGSQDSRNDISREGSPQRPRTIAPELYIDTMAHLKKSPISTTPPDGSPLRRTYLEMRDCHTPPLPSSSSSPPASPAIRVESNMRSRNSSADASALTTPRPPRTPLHHKVYPDLAPKLQTELRAGRHVHADASTHHRVESSRSQPNLSARGVYANLAPKLETESRAKGRTLKTSASSSKATPLPRVARLAISQSARKYQTPSRHRVYADLAPHLVTDSRAKYRQSTPCQQPQSPASIPGSLNLIPLRREKMFQKREHTDTCTSQFLAHLHPNVGPCDRCWYMASPAEQAKFRARGTHLCIARTRGGCDRDCKVFPPEEDEHAVRLCRKCFTATHKQEQLQVYRGNHKKVR